MKKEVFTPKGMKVFGGPVAEAVIAGGFAFVSGQIALDPETGDIIHGTIQEETRAALSNLEAAGGGDGSLSGGCGEMRCVLIHDERF